MVERVFKSGGLDAMAIERLRARYEAGQEVGFKEARGYVCRIFSIERAQGASFLRGLAGAGVIEFSKPGSIVFKEVTQQ